MDPLRAVPVRHRPKGVFPVWPERWFGSSSASGRPVGMDSFDACTTKASSDRVAASNTARIGTVIPHSSRSRPASRVASTEWPPSLKKLSPGLTSGTARSSLTSRHSRLSTEVGSSPGGPAGAAASGCAADSARSRNAARSILPLAVTGSRCSTCTDDGTMCSGRVSAECALSSAAETPAPATVLTKAARRAPARSPTTTTAATSTAGWAARPRLDLAELDAEATDRSPGRRPRLAKTNSPSARPVAPVAGAVHPAAGWAEGSSTNRLAVRPGRFR